MHKVDAYNYLTIVKYEQIILIIRIFFYNRNIIV